MQGITFILQNKSVFFPRLAPYVLAVEALS